MHELTRFTVDVPEADLADLRERLERTRWPDQPPDPASAGWAYGTELSYLRDLVSYWREGFDWRLQERLLNRFAQYTVPLAGITLHFVHQRGVGPAPMPLLLSHGWPSSVWEFHKLIPMLTDPAASGGDPADAFTVIAPSLPGYAFSFHPGQPRFGTEEIADAFAELMTAALGYQRFAAAGGDWGAFISARLGEAHREHLHGIHVTLMPRWRTPAPATADEGYRRQLEHWMREESGYSAVQGTKPQTLAYALTDSPVGLAAWIVEKFRTWSDCRGDLESRFTKDELLTNVTIYWVTGAIGSSFWPYYARQHRRWPASGRIEVPTAFAAFPREIVRPPRELVGQVFDLRRYTRMPAGGHFAALEEPGLLAGDIREFFRSFR